MLKAELLAPSALGAAELATWTGWLAENTALQRGFFAPGFARACETASGLARVAVLHEGGTVRAFLPFQFRTRWHARVGLAERIGGLFCDNAGLIAPPGFTIAPAALLRRCRLGSLFLTHLAEEQAAFGLGAAEWRIGHRIDLGGGWQAYLDALNAGRRGFVADTERRLRRAERDYGTLDFRIDTAPDWAAVAPLIAAKRAQYHRTGAADGFEDPTRLRLIEALLAAPTAECRPLLTTLAAGGRVLAQHLGLRHGGVLNYWFPVYDPAAQKVSPGRLLLWRTLQAAADLGLALIDRGEGDSEAKRDFSTGTARLGVAHWTSGTWRAAAARAWQAAAWRLERRRSGAPAQSGSAQPGPVSATAGDV
ncbi:MAG: GNAT family N-acetyltransferase [Alphaproteobacteria bacterium]|nr:GNAT family N-acetyltransferase [Alphaproteobacteria bacterium]